MDREVPEKRHVSQGQKSSLPAPDVDNPAAPKYAQSCVKTCSGVSGRPGARLGTDGAMLTAASRSHIRIETTPASELNLNLWPEMFEEKEEEYGELVLRLRPVVVHRSGRRCVRRSNAS